MLEEKNCCTSQIIRTLRMLTCRMMRRRLIPGQATSTGTKRWPHRLSSRHQKRQTRPWNWLSTPPFDLCRSSPEPLSGVSTDCLPCAFLSVSWETFTATFSTGRQSSGRMVSGGLVSAGRHVGDAFGENTQDKIWLGAGLYQNRSTTEWSLVRQGCASRILDGCGIDSKNRPASLRLLPWLCQLNLTSIQIYVLDGPKQWWPRLMRCRMFWKGWNRKPSSRTKKSVQRAL